MPVGSIAKPPGGIREQNPRTEQGMYSQPQRGAKWYGLPGTTCTDITTAQINQYTYFYAFAVERPIVIDGYCYEVTTAGDATARRQVGIYRQSDHTRSLNRVVAWNPIGWAPSVVPTLYEVSVPPITLAPGLHSLAFGTIVAAGGGAIMRRYRMSTDTGASWSLPAIGPWYVPTRDDTTAELPGTFDTYYWQSTNRPTPILLSWSEA